MAHVHAARDAHGHHHHHGPGHAHAHAIASPREVTRRLKAVLAVTGLFLVVEAIGGYLSGSLALLADAGHMFADVGALSLSLFTAWLVQRPADDSKTFGYRRWEILAAVVNGVALVLIAFGIVEEAIDRFRSPHELRLGLFFGVGVVGLAVNLFALSRLHGMHQHSLNVRGAYLHILGDTLGSVGAIAAAVVIFFTGWVVVDPILSVVLSLLILASAWRLLRESVDVLLEAAPPHVSMPEVREAMRGVAGVVAVHDVHVWTVTSGMVALSGHLVVPDLADHGRVLADVRHRLAHLGINHVTLQLEADERCGGTPCDGEVATPR